MDSLLEGLHYPGKSQGSHKICYPLVVEMAEKTLYRNNSKNWDTIMIRVIVVKVE